MRSERIYIRVTPAEKKKLEAAAKKDNRKLSGLLYLMVQAFIKARCK